MTQAGWTALQRRLLLRYEAFKTLLTRRLGSAELAGDALQDTWLRLERGGESTPVRSADTYLLSIAVNLARDQRRSENRRLTTSEVEVLLDLVDDAPDPEQVAEARSDLGVLKMVMAELPARQRSILLAARLQGASRREIAERHGISQRFVQRELQEAQDYCAARMRTWKNKRFRSDERQSSSGQEPLIELVEEGWEPASPRAEE
jgi:RNA polymerase sigma-70 factor (ECF subfamily)